MRAPFSGRNGHPAGRPDLRWAAARRDPRLPLRSASRAHAQATATSGVRWTWRCGVCVRSWPRLTVEPWSDQRRTVAAEAEGLTQSQECRYLTAPTPAICATAMRRAIRLPRPKPGSRARGQFRVVRSAPSRKFRAFSSRGYRLVGRPSTAISDQHGV